MIELSATALGISGVDMKAVATTQYTSGVIDLGQLQVGRNIREMRGAPRAQLFVTIDNTGGGASGLATVKVQPVDSTGTALGPEISAATSINTKADTNAVIGLGGGLAGSALNGTIGSDVDVLRLFGRFKLILEVQEANDGTTCVGSLAAQFD